MTLTSFDLILAFCGSFHFPQFRIQINVGFSFRTAFIAPLFYFNRLRQTQQQFLEYFFVSLKNLFYDMIFFFLSFQEGLEKCGESLQEIINYHMVSRPALLHIQLDWDGAARWYHPDWLLKASRGSNIPSGTILRVRTELGLHVDFFSHTSLNLSVWLSVRAVITSQNHRGRERLWRRLFQSSFRPASLNSESD